MTLVEAYYDARKLERGDVATASSGDRLEARLPPRNHTILLGALGCLWAAAFTIKLSWFLG